MITTEGKNACLRINFCGMTPVANWYLIFFNQNPDEYTDFADGRPIWTPENLIDEKVIGSALVLPQSYDVILSIGLISTSSGPGITYATYELENPLEFNADQTLTIRLPVGWR